MDTNKAAPQKNVLVVDDDNDARLLLCKMLQKLGYTTFDYDSGEAALADGLAQKKFKFACLDIMMPNMNGYELLQKLRSSTAFANLPVMMVTARDQDTEILEGYKYGANYYITKPYTLKQLEYGIKMVLDGY